MELGVLFQGGSDVRLVGANRAFKGLLSGLLFKPGPCPLPLAPPLHPPQTENTTKPLRQPGWVPYFGAGCSCQYHWAWDFRIGEGSSPGDHVFEGTPTLVCETDDKTLKLLRLNPRMRGSS